MTDENCFCEHLLCVNCGKSHFTALARKCEACADAEEIAELRAEVERLRAVVDSLPPCVVWTHGSGGHRVFVRCPEARISTYTDDADVPHYCCDEHLPINAKRGYDPSYTETSWAEAIRALEEE